MLRGYSGYNTAWALHLLAKVFSEGMRPPALVTVFFGANDAVLKGRIRRVGQEATPVTVPGTSSCVNSATSALLAAAQLVVVV